MRYLAFAIPMRPAPKAETAPCARLRRRVGIRCTRVSLHVQALWASYDMEESLIIADRIGVRVMLNLHALVQPHVLPLLNTRSAHAHAHACAELMSACMRCCRLHEHTRRRRYVMSLCKVRVPGWEPSSCLKDSPSTCCAFPAVPEGAALRYGN